MSARGGGPVRTCVGCRRRAEKRSLLRVVLDADGTFAPDASGRAPGRGAYVHREASCVEAATARGALARALRASAHAGGAARLLEAVPPTASPATSSGSVDGGIDRAIEPINGRAIGREGTGTA